MHNGLKHKLTAHMVWMNIRLDKEMHADSAVFQMHAVTMLFQKFIFFSVLEKTKCMSFHILNHVYFNYPIGIFDF